LHGSSWEPWLRRFRDEGDEPYAPGWLGDSDTVMASQQNASAIGDHGIDDVVAHLAGIIDELLELPILIGHSFGGMIVQNLLGQDRAKAAVAIDAAQIKGVLPVPLSALRATLPARPSEVADPDGVRDPAHDLDGDAPPDPGHVDLAARTTGRPTPPRSQGGLTDG
jgi:pimeloyl-ACP methyl ester carboxylesterase